MSGFVTLDVKDEFAVYIFLNNNFVLPLVLSYLLK